MKIRLAFLLVLCGFSNLIAITIDIDGDGISISPYVLGQFCKDMEGNDIAVGLCYRGIAGGLVADSYNWKEATAIQSICKSYLYENSSLEFLRTCRDRNVLPFITVNTRGTGITGSWDSFIYTDTSIINLENLASDWVRYTERIVQLYSSGQTPTGDDYSVWNSITWSPKLLSSDEKDVPKVKYWEIGNEPAVVVGQSMFPLSSSEYSTRYKAITNAMRSEDYGINGQYTIKVGPCGCLPDDAELQAVYNDLNSHIDFVSYHPYGTMRYVWNDVANTQILLADTYAFHEGKVNQLNQLLANAGRNPQNIERIASEWNPMDWNCWSPQFSMAQALGVGETIFSFVRLNFKIANFWGHTIYWNANLQTYQQAPSYKLFKEMQMHIGDELISVNAPNSHLKIYVTRNNQTGSISVWGLNFNNTNTMGAFLNFQNLDMSNKTKYQKTLGRVDSTPTTLFSRSNECEIDWKTEYVAGFDPSNYYFSVPAASIRVFIITSRVKADFDGDAASDLVLYDSSQFKWNIKYSASNFTTSNEYVIGVPNAIPLCGSWDGDGKADLAYVNLSSTPGQWAIDYSVDGFNGVNFSKSWGESGDIPICGDWDGDGKTDIAVFRPSTRQWYIDYSNDGFNGTNFSKQWGVTGDVPVIGDYDGDGKTDLAVFRQAGASGGYDLWVIDYSFDGFNGTNITRTLGSTASDDKPMAGDIDGDGKTDIIVYRSGVSSYRWWVLRSSDGYISSDYYTHGGASYNDITSTGDYDGDGKMDISIWRPSSTAYWYIYWSFNSYTDLNYFQHGSGNTHDVVDRAWQAK